MTRYHTTDYGAPLPPIHVTGDRRMRIPPHPRPCDACHHDFTPDDQRGRQAKVCMPCRRKKDLADAQKRAAKRMLLTGHELDFGAI